MGVFTGLIFLRKLSSFSGYIEFGPVAGGGSVPLQWTASEDVFPGSCSRSQRLSRRFWRASPARLAASSALLCSTCTTACPVRRSVWAGSVCSECGPEASSPRYTAPAHGCVTKLNGKTLNLTRRRTSVWVSDVSLLRHYVSSSSPLGANRNRRSKFALAPPSGQ